MEFGVTVKRYYYGVWREQMENGEWSHGEIGPWTIHRNLHSISKMAEIFVWNAGYPTIVTDFWSKCRQSYTILLIDYESVARLVE